jgi:hypothetical protein
VSPASVTSRLAGFGGRKSSPQRAERVHHRRSCLEQNGQRLAVAANRLAFVEVARQLPHRPPEERPLETRQRPSPTRWRSRRLSGA